MATYGTWQGGLATYGHSYSNEPITLVLGTHVANEFHIIHATYTANDYVFTDATYNFVTYESNVATYMDSYGVTYTASYYRDTYPNVRAIEWV